MKGIIAAARDYLGRSRAEVQALLGAEAEHVAGDEYGRMVGVTSISGSAVFPGTLYLRNDEVELVYVGDAALSDVSRSDLEAQLGGEPVHLRSRAGKQATMGVHAEQGVAYSAQGDALDFLEVFRPRGQEAYEAEIYLEPSAFIR